MIKVATIDPQGRPEGGFSTDVVPWWSFTKTLIAAAALRLAERGRLALDEPLTGLPYTPRQLLQHRAGVGDYGQLPDYQAAVARGRTLDRRPALRPSIAGEARLPSRRGLGLLERRLPARAPGD
jgi:CubicO group peptidase (beta-lactamase class C family)